MPLRHEVVTEHERGWSKMKSRELLDAAEKENFDVFVATDSNLVHPQHLGSQAIAIVVRSSSGWPRIQRALAAVIRAVERAADGGVIHVDIP